MRSEIENMKGVQSEMDHYLSLWRYDILECIYDITAMASRGGRDPKIIADALNEARKKLRDSEGRSPKFTDLAARHAAAVEAATAAIEAANAEIDGALEFAHNPLPEFIEASNARFRAGHR